MIHSSHNTPLLLDGKKLATELGHKLFDYLTYVYKERGIRPKLAAILSTDNFASKTYVSRKSAACELYGLSSVILNLQNVTSDEFYGAILELNNDPEIDGILVQLPLRHDLSQKKTLQLVDPTKDVDGFHPVNLGKLITSDTSGFIPCTPLGIATLLKSYNIPVAGKHVVVVGRSVIVGRPLSILLSQNSSFGNATVTLAHSKTADLVSITCQADILVVACGSCRLITKKHIKPGAVVVDVGTNSEAGRLVGDVDFASCSSLATAISPVPGGVGPMTIISLLHNTVLSFARRHQLPAPPWPIDIS